jgi:protein-S-isoprenylcysteine O-methyltransferase Ste14
LAVKPDGALLIADFDFRILSMASMALGLIILLVAFINLKPSLRVSPIPIPGAPLITVGIYKFFRHPMYLGVLLVAASIATQNLDAMSLISWLALFVVLSVKAAMEDSLLRMAHPHAADYQRRVPGLSWLRNA